MSFLEAQKIKCHVDSQACLQNTSAHVSDEEADMSLGAAQGDPKEAPRGQLTASRMS